MTNPRPVRRRPRRAIRREVSAGGVVARRDGTTWLIALLKTEHKRGEVWVLPKGHVEPAVGETVADAAVTRYAFQAEQALVRKTVHYFLMVTQQKRLSPQKEEGLLDAIWQPFDAAIAMLAYDTDKDIVARARERLTGIRRPPPSRAYPRAARRIHI